MMAKFISKREFIFSFCQIMVVVACLLPVVSAAENNALTHEQKTFLAAEKAFKKGKSGRYQNLKASLEGYVLYPYLEYQEARSALGNKARVNEFSELYADSPMASRLQTSRLRYLGKNGRWAEYLKEYNGSSNTKLKCYYLRAKGIIKGKGGDWKDEVKEVWLTGKTLPPVCNPLFLSFYDSGAVSSQLALERVQLAIKKNNLSLAKYLAKKLNKTDYRWYELWLKMNKKPLKTLKGLVNAKDSAPLEDAVVYGVIRYARKDTVGAWNFWRDDLRTRFDFSQEQIDEVEGKLVLRAAWRHLPEAHAWFSDVSDSSLNDEARQWKVRTAIRHGDWAAALRAIEGLPSGEKNDHQWRYWKARALGQTGETVQANVQFDNLALETSYYGFMAAERMNRPYVFNSIPVVTPEEEGAVDELLHRDGIRRAQELYQLGREADAMREWRHETQQMGKPDKKLAAKLAQRWGWHFAAILTVSKAGHLKDLELRFPLAYREDIYKAAKKHGVDASWIYGVARRESAFRETAVSPAGALGLMQLMPGTAKNVARKLGLPRHSKKELKIAKKNINLGASYLKEVQNQYAGHEVLATASYNAGPHRVKKWLPDEGVLEADVWVDSITFDETRAYVKAVFFYSTIFDWKLNGQSRSLAERMPPVKTLADIQPTRRGA